MSEKQEMVADIVAEMRTPQKGESGYLAAWRDEIASRIEAAHKREVDALTEKLETARHCWKAWSDRADELKNKCNEQYGKLKSVGNADIGNCAKMREALKAIVDVFDLKEPMSQQERELVVYNLAKNALSEPRRNCDVYNSETCRMAYHMKGPGLMTMQAFADWLFAPYESEVEK